jgi:hypothetical protein
MATSRWILLTMKNVSNETVGKRKTHILCSVTFRRKSCRLWDNVKKIRCSRRGRRQCRKRVAYWISKATRAKVQADAVSPTHTRIHSATRARSLSHTHTQTRARAVIFNTFPRQLWFRERAPQCYVIRILPLVFVVWRVVGLCDRPTARSDNFYMFSVPLYHTETSIMQQPKPDLCCRDTENKLIPNSPSICGDKR